MRLFRDIESPWLLHAKGWLFFVVAATAAAILIAREPTLWTIATAALLVWGSCRFYYYLFYVLEHYAGRRRPYAGLIDELGAIFAAGARRGAPSEAASAGTSPNRVVDLARALSSFTEHWQPRVVGAFNDHDLLVVKVKGEFVWHRHDETDDFFLVLKGRITIRLREGDVKLGEGELFVVPRGVEHCPVAADEAHLLLIERRGTPNTGDPATAQPRRVIAD